MFYNSDLKKECILQLELENILMELLNGIKSVSSVSRQIDNSY